MKVDRVEQKLVGSTATHQADGSIAVDKEELAGRGSRRAGDDRWEGKVLRVKEIRMGMVEDQQGKLHSMTKVQPVPSSTRSTKTVRMDRAVLPFRKARTDEACRAFIRNQVVPALRNKPERMMNTRVL